jgi:quercetin dioxygenase-like cupin family protein
MIDHVAASASDLHSSPTGAPSELWFLDTFVRIRVSTVESQDGVSVLEHCAPFADSPPLHVHHTEDEYFIVLDGELRFRIGDGERRHGPGDVILAPRDTPHTYRCESPSGGRWITITARGDFERFVRAMGRPAERATLPDPAGPPTPAQIEALESVALAYGIELVGPPLR